MVLIIYWESHLVQKNKITSVLTIFKYTSISVICVLLVVFTKKEILHKNILFGIETQTHNTIILMQWVPLSAVMRHAGVTPRGTGSVSAVRVLGM